MLVAFFDTGAPRLLLAGLMIISCGCSTESSEDFPPQYFPPQWPEPPPGSSVVVDDAAPRPADPVARTEVVLPEDDRVPELGGSTLAPIWQPLHWDVGDDHRAILGELRRAIAHAKATTEAGENATIVNDALAERIRTTRNVGVERRSPTGAPNRQVQPSSHPDLLMYRIFWKGNQKWSKWYIPGVNDRDWKNTSERVWRYFEDHRHEVVLLGR